MKRFSFLSLLLFVLALVGCGDDNKKTHSDTDGAVTKDASTDAGNTDGGDVEGDGGVLMGCAEGETPKGVFPLSGGMPLWGGWQYAGGSSAGNFTPEEDSCTRTHGFYLHPIVGVPGGELTEQQKKDALCAINHGAEMTIDHGGVAPNPPDNCGETLPCNAETKLLWDAENGRGLVYQYFEDLPRQLIGYAALDDEGHLLLGPGPGYAAYSRGASSFSCFNP